MPGNSTFKTTTIDHVYDAPAEAVFKAWLEPEAVMQWHYATEGWTTPFAEIDASAGGKFSIGFKSPDGKSDFTFTGTFTDITPPSPDALGRIAYTIDGDNRPVEIVFDGDGKQTKLTLTLALETENSEEQQREGWGAMLVHLASYLETSA